MEKKTTRRKFIKDTARYVASLAAGTSILQPQHLQGNNSTPINLLFLITDQQRYDTLSRAGNKLLYTPNLDRLAYEGAYFKNAYAYCPICVPGRAVILTGHSTESLRIRSNSDYDSQDIADVPTFDNILSSLGYNTEYYGKWHTPYKFASTYDNYVRQIAGKTAEGEVSQRNAYLQYLDKSCPQRPAAKGELIDKYSNRPYTPDPIDWRYGLSPEEQAANSSNAGTYGNLDIPFDHTRTAFAVEEALEALERLKDSPFSLTCSIAPPHPPMVLPEPYYSMYPPQDCEPPLSIDDPMDNSPYAARASSEEMQRYRNKDHVKYMISDYYGMVKDVDDWIGKILDKLEQLGLANNTLIIFTSDHGEMLGSHGMHGKTIFYEESAHIPLIVRFPGGIQPGIIVTNPVSHIDLFATILDYLSISGYKSEGHSLRPLIEGRVYSGPDFCVSEWSNNSLPNFMVRSAEWKFMFANSPNSNALDALYNLKDDPYELNNLIGNNPNRGNYLRQAEKIKTKLVSWLNSINSPYLHGVINRPVINDEPPLVSIITPENNSSVSKTLYVSTEVTNEIGIKKVEFYLNNILHKKVSTAPYSWIWNTIDQPNGSYTIKVKAWDIIDQPGEDTIKVNVENPTKKIKYGYKR
jgi:arylsulfatase A-like enzyme